MSNWIKLYKSLMMIFIFMVIFLASYDAQTASVNILNGEWVGTWVTAPQLVEPHNNPPEPGLSNNTIRQIIRVSLGGDSLRVHFSNEFSTNPVTMKAVHIARSIDSSAIDVSSDKLLTFNRKKEITIEAGKDVTSDPVKLSVQPLSNLAITIYFGNTSPDVTGHPGSRTTSYILCGDKVSKEIFENSVKTDHWYVIKGIDVIAPESAAAVAIIGNSITDGRGSGTNKQNRWTDELAHRLQENPETRQVAVLNLGIGGNCVLRNCLGPSAISRFERDVLQQSKVRWLIIFEGINDIGQVRSAEASNKVSEDLIAAYEEMINNAHAAGIVVYGATLLPFKSSFYDSEYSQSAWTKVNDWIRNSGRFDKVIDLSAALRDAANPLCLLPEADTGDHLHPNEMGHKMMAEAVNLLLFR